MIAAVLMFGVLNILFEFVLLTMLPPRIRLRVLGSERLSAAMHFAFLIANLLIHWGTVTGTMSGVMSFVCSIATVSVARKLFGAVTEQDGRVLYRLGYIKYSAKELA